MSWLTKYILIPIFIVALLLLFFGCAQNRTKTIIEDAVESELNLIYTRGGVVV